MPIPVLTVMFSTLVISVNLAQLDTMNLLAVVSPALLALLSALSVSGAMMMQFA